MQDFFHQEYEHNIDLSLFCHDKSLLPEHVVYFVFNQVEHIKIGGGFNKHVDS